jgi:uncharacterized protein YjaG (DUF416 family)
MWPFSTIATLKREKNEYKAAMGAAMAEARETVLRENILRDKIKSLEAKASRTQDLYQIALAERDTESNGRISEREAKDNVVREKNRVRAELDTALEAIRTRDDGAKRDAQIIADLHEKLKAAEKTLDQSTKNDSPKDTKTGRFTKKVVAP